MAKTMIQVNIVISVDQAISHVHDFPPRNQRKPAFPSCSFTLHLGGGDHLLPKMGIQKSRRIHIHLSADPEGYQFLTVAYCPLALHLEHESSQNLKKLPAGLAG